jgi:hypothetical protein
LRDWADFLVLRVGIYEAGSGPNLRPTVMTEVIAESTNSIDGGVRTPSTLDF